MIAPATGGRVDDRFVRPVAQQIIALLIFQHTLRTETQIVCISGERTPSPLRQVRKDTLRLKILIVALSHKGIEPLKGGGRASFLLCNGSSSRSDVIPARRGAIFNRRQLRGACRWNRTWIERIRRTRYTVFSC